MILSCFFKSTSHQQRGENATKCRSKAKQLNFREELVGSRLRPPVSKSRRSLTFSEKDMFRFLGILTVTLLSLRLLDNCRDVGCPDLHVLCQPDSCLTWLQVKLLQGCCVLLALRLNQFRRVPSSGELFLQASVNCGMRQGGKDLCFPFSRAVLSYRWILLWVWVWLVCFRSRRGEGGGRGRDSCIILFLFFNFLQYLFELLNLEDVTSVVPCFSFSHLSPS